MLSTETIIDASEWVAITGMCERFGTLPNPGGVMQQNHRHIRKMEEVLRAKNEAEKDIANKPTPPPKR